MPCSFFSNGAVGWSAVCDCGFPDHTHLRFEGLKIITQSFCLILLGQHIKKKLNLVH